MSEVMCDGTESSIFNCDQAPLGVNSCSHDQDVAIRCALSRGQYTQLLSQHVGA